MGDGCKERTAEISDIGREAGSRAEQSSPSVPAQKKMSGKEEKTDSGEEKVQQEYAVQEKIFENNTQGWIEYKCAEPMQMEAKEHLDDVAKVLVGSIRDMRLAMRTFDKFYIISETEKETLEKLFARANGFVMGIDYRR